MSHPFDKYHLPELQRYLKDHGVTTTGYSKSALKEIAVAVFNLNLPEDPDFSKDSIEISVHKKLERCGLKDIDPIKLDGYTSDFSHIPDFGLIDVFNYLIFSRADYDGKKLKSYKSFDDYRLFVDGHVESLLYNPLSEDSKNCIFKALVKPTQRDKTYLKRQHYSLWFVMEKESGSIITGYCECKGGADGTCRHLSAALYELEDFEVKSCTDKDNMWVRRPRQSDAPVPIRHMKIASSQYRDHKPKAKPHSDLYDPRPLTNRVEINDERKINFGRKLKEICCNAQVLDVLLMPEDKNRQDDENKELLTDLEQYTVMNKAALFVHGNGFTYTSEDKMCEEFFECMKYKEEIVSQILDATEGQSSNKLWFVFRAGLLTASNFHQAVKYVVNNKTPSESFIKSVLGENRLDESCLPPSLNWGRKKESVARNMYYRLQKRYHNSLKIVEKGLLISSRFTGLGCSIDGICKCKCKQKHGKLIEIKCPYSQRHLNPKDVAIEKNCVKDTETDNWKVTPQCPYYDQIQGQLGLYGLQECDLVIYTSQGIHVSNANFDEDYFLNMVKHLTFFYHTYIIPRIMLEVL